LYSGNVETLIRLLWFACVRFINIFSVRVHETHHPSRNVPVSSNCLYIYNWHIALGKVPVFYPMGHIPY